MSAADEGQRGYLLAGGLTLLGAVCLSAKAVLVKLAYRYGIDSVSLLALRMVFSLPFYLVIAWYATRNLGRIYRPVGAGDLWKIFLLGIMGYYLASLFDFLGLQYVEAGMERLILFIYPTIVVLISALLNGRPISRRQYLALGLTYLGILIAFSEQLLLRQEEQFLLGAGLIFLSAFSFSVYFIGSGQMLPRIGTWRFTSYAMSAAALAVILHHGLFFRWDLFGFPWQVYALALLMALLATVVPSFLISEGIRRIGAGNAAIIGSVGPISTILLAWLFLDERLGPWQWLGTFVVIAGVLMVTLNRPAATERS